MLTRYEEGEGVLFFDGQSDAPICGVIIGTQTSPDGSVSYAVRAGKDEYELPERLLMATKPARVLN